MNLFHHWVEEACEELPVLLSQELNPQLTHLLNFMSEVQIQY